MQIGLGILGGLVLLVLLIGVVQTRRLPSLEVWHRVRFEHEFRASRSREVPDFTAYLELEERLFRELDRKVYRELGSDGDGTFDRFRRGSRSDPARRQPNGNRSYEIAGAEPGAGAALLLHGLTDSPYSMRSLAELFSAHGLAVVGLRAPGHGTAPGSLSRIHRRDWKAAVRLAAARAEELAGGGALYFAGYSTGATLALTRVVETLEGGAGRLPDRLFLFSPAYGVSAAARMANWHKIYSFLPPFHAARWASIAPEYDPYKYNSFPKNAGDQVHLAIQELRRAVERLDRTGGLDRLPPVTSFQSIVDATVITRDLIDQLYARLPANGSELVLFDVNHVAEITAFLDQKPAAIAERLAAAAELPYRYTLITNRGSDTRQVVARSRPPGAGFEADQELGLRWPNACYSLSHVALTFPPDDPVYGNLDPGERDAFNLGSVAPRGERGLLRIGVDQLLRLRFNPFFDYVRRRLERAVAPRRA